MQEKSDPCKLQLLLGHRKAVKLVLHTYVLQMQMDLCYCCQSTGLKTKYKHAFLWIDPVFLFLSCILSLLTPHKLRCLVRGRPYSAHAARGGGGSTKSVLMRAGGRGGLRGFECARVKSL